MYDANGLTDSDYAQFAVIAIPYATGITTPITAVCASPLKDPIYANKSMANLEIGAASAPASPAPYQFWYDTANSKLKFYDGTQWNEVTLTPVV
jgi:endoglucanase Acf2